ncbi:hypothetical protein Zm00014a_036876 [Zea mays]|uniref:Uncharacterized protein n=1 Tax=Zea mays TaxID=4577 RepID=A0A3L6E7N1_MAIZE|nr:hypothetical protein Zm00014a_036876 [Zea mays]
MSKVVFGKLPHDTRAPSLNYSNSNYILV